MDEITLREQADRYLLGKLSLNQLNDCVAEIIISEMRYGERDDEDSRLAAVLLCFITEGTHVKEIHGHFDEETFRQELAAHFYMQQLGAAQSEETAKAATAAL